MDKEQDDINENKLLNTQKHNGKCQKCRIFCLACWKPCLKKYNPLPPQPSVKERIRFAFTCPPHGIIGHYITVTLSVIVMMGVLIALLREHALPGGNFFGLYILIILCIIAGKIVEKIRLPPLLGKQRSNCK